MSLRIVSINPQYGVITASGLAVDLIQNIIDKALALAREREMIVVFDGNDEQIRVFPSGEIKRIPRTPKAYAFEEGGPINMAATIIRAWIFSSSYDENKTYETLLYGDRTVSCSCPGWTRRCAPDGTRSCRHVRLVHMGQADRECVSKVDYSEGTPAYSTPTTTTNTRTKPHGTKKTKAEQQSTFGEFGGRSIIR